MGEMTPTTTTMDRVEQIGGNVYALPGADVPMHDSRAKEMRQAAYIEWLIRPKEQREPHTKTAVAELLGVTVATLLNYEKEPRFRGEVQRRLGAIFRIDKLSDIFATLFTIATDAESPRAVSAAKVLVEWSERATESAGIDFSKYTDSDIETARAALAADGQ